VETTGGSVASTKQFVWAGSQRVEERDVGSNVVSQFFPLGQKTNGTAYFYTIDHLGSVREMTNTAGAIQAQYGYDPYGKMTPIGTPSIDSDFQYARYYFHAPSGLFLTRTREYNASLGRFINRDQIEEQGGVNLFEYCKNNPVSNTDPSGMLTISWSLLTISFRSSANPIVSFILGSGNEMRVFSAQINPDFTSGLPGCLQSCDLAEQALKERCKCNSKPQFVSDCMAEVARAYGKCLMDCANHPFPSGGGGPDGGGEPASFPRDNVIQLKGGIKKAS
jgi:RHS repeat-associated protein